MSEFDRERCGCAVCICGEVPMCHGGQMDKDMYSEALSAAINAATGGYDFDVVLFCDHRGTPRDNA